MLVVVNGDFGGYSVPEELVAEMGLTWCYADEMSVRSDMRFVEWVLAHETDLVVVEMPDTATDWRIEDYDGIETLWYVEGGKMYTACEIDDIEDAD